MLPVNPDDETKRSRALSAFARLTSTEFALVALTNLSEGTAARLLEALGWADLKQLRAIDQLLDHHAASGSEPPRCEHEVNALIDLIESGDYYPSLRPWLDVASSGSPTAGGDLRSA